MQYTADDWAVRWDLDRFVMGHRIKLQYATRAYVDRGYLARKLFILRLV